MFMFSFFVLYYLVIVMQWFNWLQMNVSKLSVCGRSDVGYKYIDIKYKTHSLLSLHSIQNMTETSFSPQEKKECFIFHLYISCVFIPVLVESNIPKVSLKCITIIIIHIFIFSLFFCLTITVVL